MFKAGFVGLFGLSNAGKSSFMNRLLGESLSMVSAKAQSTRERIHGILTKDKEQFVFIDAPGYIEADKGLNSFLQRECLSVLKSSDVVLLFLNVDAREKDSVLSLIEMAKKSKKPVVALIGKVDLVEYLQRITFLKTEMAQLGWPTFEWSHNWEVKTEFEYSRFLAALSAPFPPSTELLYPVDEYTTDSMRTIARQFISQACFDLLENELPYFTAVLIRRFKENEDGSYHIDADIWVGKESHKSIVIGKNAEMIKNIGIKARSYLEKSLHAKVGLKLNVAVKDSWMTQPSWMKELGYVVKPELDE